jgi:hypothetical protein
MAEFKGYRDGTKQVVLVDGNQLIAIHRPDDEENFNWGYSNSNGAKYLSEAIIFHCYKDLEVANKYKLQFKRDVIESLPNSWELSENKVREVINGYAEK